MYLVHLSDYIWGYTYYKVLKSLVNEVVETCFQSRGLSSVSEGFTDVVRIEILRGSKYQCKLLIIYFQEKDINLYPRAFGNRILESIFIKRNSYVNCL